MQITHVRSPSLRGLPLALRPGEEGEFCERMASEMSFEVVDCAGGSSASLASEGAIVVVVGASPAEVVPLALGKSSESISVSLPVR